ncbi:uncharacterized protein JCM15063_001228 [Sporobolomyces koalae]|uniref:uncharacterized protein n=1 Tax=Sporobolomyces koalae TaxID=500713 RepID=UPI003178AF79
MQSLDQPLDAIIQSKRKERQPRRQRGSRPQSAKQAAGVAPAKGAAAPVNAAQAVAAQVHVGDKIIVSNLPDDVNEAQIKELFHTTCGPVRSVNLSYNAQGKSKGTATIQFQRADSATSAYQQYNKRLIDGKRPMKVEIVVDPSRAGRAGAGASLSQRVAPAAASATVAAASGSAVQPGRQGQGARRGAGGRGRGRRGGKNGGDRSERPAATVESLDQEMSDWQASVQTSGDANAATTA